MHTSSSSSSTVLLMLLFSLVSGPAAEQSAAHMLQLASACVPLPADPPSAAADNSRRNSCGRASTAAVLRNPVTDKLSQQVRC
jgi:hypothetical protein